MPRYDTWSKPNTENIIGRKRVDLSLLKYGTHIPQEYRSGFLKATTLDMTQASTSQKIKFIFDDCIIEGDIRKPDVQRRSDEVVQLNFKADLLSYLKKEFSYSYKILIEQNRTSEIMDEYMEFYDTGVLNEIKVKLIKHNDVDLYESINRIAKSYLNAREREQFAGHWLGELIRDKVPEQISTLNFINKDKYYIKGSIGQGNWVKVPWIAIMYKDITTTTQKGVYLVYLFSEDMKSIYLTLMQGVTEYRDKFKRYAGDELMKNAARIRKMIGLEEGDLVANIALGDGDLGNLYQQSVAATIHYNSSNLPDNNKLIGDLNKMVELYERYINGGQTSESDPIIVIEENKHTIGEILEYVNKYIFNEGYTFDESIIKNFYISLKTKPFVILAGISGTGKSKLVEIFANALGATSKNGRYNLIPVRPDWSDPSDLLGYKNLNGDFQIGQLTSIIRDALDNPDEPYFICLDEMNLARVEYYFSDILSLIETRRKDGDKIITNNLFKDNMLEQSISGNNLTKLFIPENLFIVGTVNMDETTFPFSKKVLDRANTIEFNEVDLEVDFDKLISNAVELAPITVDNSFLCSKYLKIKDCVEQKEVLAPIIKSLQDINKILEESSLHFGYRVRDEICFYIAYAEGEQLMTKQEALDIAILQKIMPRIQGNNATIKEVLIRLFNYLTKNNIDVNPSNNQVSDEMQEYINNATSLSYPKTCNKIMKMIRRYEFDGFTTFWE